MTHGQNNLQKPQPDEAAADHSFESLPVPRKILSLLLLFFSWFVSFIQGNQVDYL